ncbi:MAG: caspase family protein, partial [Chitinophagales bacterium]|nr:caspase family protein [Chitinophagales bacterium]
SKHHRKDLELEQTFLHLGVSAEDIISLYDAETTLENIYAAFDSIAATSDAETHFVFYFSGHGFPGYGYIDDRESIYFANYDIDTWYPETTGFNIDYIGDAFIHAFKGNAVLFMADCCQSGGLIEQAQKFSLKGVKSAAITSCAASNWSTGNWTFTQKVIDGLNGDAFINTNGDGAVTYNEMISQINLSMKNNERQKYASAFFNWDVNEQVVKTNQRMSILQNTDFYTGQYVFVKRKNNYFPMQITGETNGKVACRFYNYADYEEYDVVADSIKIPYYVHYDVGDIVDIESSKQKTAAVEEADDDFYKVVETGGAGTLWLTYERLSDGTEQSVLIRDDYNNWLPGKILATDAGKYFITYDDKSYQWDQWVTADRIEF